ATGRELDANPDRQRPPHPAPGELRRVARAPGGNGRWTSTRVATGAGGEVSETRCSYETFGIPNTRTAPTRVALRTDEARTSSQAGRGRLRRSQDVVCEHQASETSPTAPRNAARGTRERDRSTLSEC